MNKSLASRRRLPSQMRRAKHSGLPAWQLALMAMPFLLVGMAIFASFAGWISLFAPEKSTAPLWVLMITGATFTALGLYICSLSLRQWLYEQRLARIRPGDVVSMALADYPWTPPVETPARWRDSLVHVGFSVAMTIFLSVFNWWAFFTEQNSVMLMIIVGTFNLILIAMWCKVATLLARAIRHGSGSVRFSRFPYSPDEESIDLTWIAPASLHDAGPATFTMTCWREGYVSTGRRHEGPVVQHEVLWEDVIAVEMPAERWREIPLVFRPAPNLPGTHFRDSPIHYWELEVRVKQRGIDLKQWYLIPVYSSC